MTGWCRPAGSSARSYSPFGFRRLCCPFFRVHALWKHCRIYKTGKVHNVYQQIRTKNVSDVPQKNSRTNNHTRSLATNHRATVIFFDLQVSLCLRVRPVLTVPLHKKSRNHVGRHVLLLLRPTSHVSLICCRSWHGFRRPKWTTNWSLPPTDLAYPHSPATPTFSGPDMVRPTFQNICRRCSRPALARTVSNSCSSSWCKRWTYTPVVTSSAPCGSLHIISAGSLSYLPNIIRQDVEPVVWWTLDWYAKSTRSRWASQSSGWLMDTFASMSISVRFILSTRPADCGCYGPSLSAAFLVLRNGRKCRSLGLWPP
ncbi:hypothetical protein T05_2270 [Trichinella murrelli]|uniref:Uncharacterized protein n=1 Tax=Trichinella murrelli TaxID=144512 RepID=A0A0V0TE66_9BILA|nr:hypothetical protein T05_2270 [Trichinella murrelli]